MRYIGSNFRSHQYPVRYQIPGHVGLQNREKIEGQARRIILHALTYHGIPPEIDNLIENQLPSEAYLQTLDQTQQEYLSFTVYILNQMAAQGSISSETVWSLFNWDLNNNLQEVTTDNFTGMRQAFMQKTANRLGKGIIPSKLTSPLEIEFWF